MKSFKELKSELNESKMKIRGVNVSITKKGNKYSVVIDGKELDKFSSEAEAKKGAKDFIDLMKK